MICKTDLVRNLILDMLESGNLQEGERLPGARKIAQQAGASLVTAQNAILNLAREGVLRTSGRSGTYVEHGWMDRILPNTFKNFFYNFQWGDEVRNYISKHLPQLRQCKLLRNAMFGTSYTRWVQLNHENLMDLGGLFDELYPDKSDFYEEAFSAYNINGRQIGIPVFFSPVLMYYNPAILAESGLPPPAPGWTIDDFMDYIRRLRKTLAPEQIFPWNMDENRWMAFVFRCGGKLMENSGGRDTVCISEPETVRGIEIWRDIYRTLNFENRNARQLANLDTFGQGKCAFDMGGRQAARRFSEFGLENWGVVPLPEVPGGTRMTTQHAESIYVMNECSDIDTVRQVISTMLSDEMQNILGSNRSGICIKKSSVAATTNMSDPNDSRFLSEIPHMSCDYNLNSEEIANLVKDGINILWYKEGSIKKDLADLSQAVQTVLNIRRKKKELTHLLQ